MSRILIKHASELVTCKGTAPKHGKDMSDIGRIGDGAVLIEDDRIVCAGTTDEVLKGIDEAACEVIDATGKTVLPGFVDSHTHFIFGGYRADEFSWRLKGDTYMSIMERGGGINATVVPTRSATQQELVSVGRERLNRMLEFGVTTVEGKSGYGMDHDCEMNMLRAMKELDETHPVDVVSTFMGPHSVLPEWKGKERAYIDFVLNDVMPDVKKEQLAEFADIFTEKGVFNAADTAYYLEHAKEAGFKLKIHADEMFAIGGTKVAVKAGAHSADHLLKVTDEGIGLLAESDTIATLLPCTAFCLKEPYAPARKLIDAGCAVALASDFNPGSCFTNSIPLIVALGCIYMNMSIEEVITALTINGAAAVGRADRIGSVEAGKQADLVILKHPSVNYMPYHTTINLVERVIKKGRTVYEKTW
ncbi:MAG: imidazolonepropionase [Lachnospiraceae bacterium]|nr:imidazolonepropionase [Lachnospiraceae bacterium]